MRIDKNNKGFLFTIAAIILILPLAYLVSYYGGTHETRIDDTVGRMRCEELHYLVEDIRRDMGRAVQVFGRRAAVYAVDYVVSPSTSEARPLKDYAFQCGPSCGVECSEFDFEETGSEAAIAELILCGTLDGEAVEQMENHTLPKWIDMMEAEAARMHFNMSIDVVEVKVVPMDAWHFAVFINNRIRANDEKGLCYYSERIVTFKSNSSIIGLDDPTYEIYSKKQYMGPAKKIINCTEFDLGFPEGFSSKPDSSDPSGESLGDGYGGGNVLLYSEVADILGFNSATTPDDVCTYGDRFKEDLNKTILVLDTGFGTLANSICSLRCPDYFNKSRSYHFAGVVDYKTNSVVSLVGDCVNISWVRSISDIGLTAGECVTIVNDNGCEPPEHTVFRSIDSSDLNTTCFFVSDVNSTYNDLCSSEEYPNGPSFFDRLDGSLNLSKKYVDQSVEYFDQPNIGIESMVNPYNLTAYKYESATWIDYLYWNKVPGCDVAFYCDAGEISFKLDCPHAHKYRMPTSCIDVAFCPECNDGRCVMGETYLDCLADCGYRCPAECPGRVILEGCKNPCGGNQYSVTYNLTVFDCSLNPLELFMDPTVTATSGGLLSSDYVMARVDVGEYQITTGCFSGNDEIRGNLTVEKSGCLTADVEEYFEELGTGSNPMPDC